MYCIPMKMEKINKRNKNEDNYLDLFVILRRTLVNFIDLVKLCNLLWMMQDSYAIHFFCNK